MMIENIILLVMGACCLTGAVVFLLRPQVPAALSAFIGLCLLHWSGYISLPVSTFVFWGASSLIAWGITCMLPKGEADGTIYGNIYLTLGALAGLLIGMSIDASVMILCSIAGTVLGQFAYSRTPKGCWLKFPSSAFIHYFCAKGLVIIVTISMVGIALEGLIRN